MLRVKKTGNKRYRVKTRFMRKPLVVLQIEVEGFVPEYTPVSIEGEFRKWWEDARPEMLLINPTPTID